LLTFFPNVFGVNIRNFYSRDFFWELNRLCFP
jgi:hypothetical protein